MRLRTEVLGQSACDGQKKNKSSAKRQVLNNGTDGRIAFIVPLNSSPNDEVLVKSGNHQSFDRAHCVIDNALVDAGKLALSFRQKRRRLLLVARVDGRVITVVG